MIDRVIAALEQFAERYHEMLVDCIPDPSDETYSNDWKNEMIAAANDYAHYKAALELVRRTRRTTGLPNAIRLEVYDFIEEMEWN